MGLQRDESLLHYNYFLALEQDLEHLSRFVDFGANENTYSLEIARILMAASAECDVLLKQLCKNVDPNSKASSIGEYHAVLINAMPDFLPFEVTMPRFGLGFTPWIDWNPQNAPFWWKANNQVKHHRSSHFNKATLKHALNAVAALFIVVLHYCRREAQEGLLMPTAILFDRPVGLKATMVSGDRGVTRQYLWPGDKPGLPGAQVLEVANGELRAK